MGTQIPIKLLLSAVLLSGSVGAAAARPKPEAAFPARAGKARLVFECGDEKAIWLRVWHPPRGWQADRAAEVTIGGQRFKTEIDGASDSFLLSDVKLPAMGLTEGLIAAAKAGEELVLSGLAAEQIPGPNRSFPLKGARAKIERVEKACGRPLAALPPPRGGDG